MTGNEIQNNDVWHIFVRLIPICFPCDDDAQVNFHLITGCGDKRSLLYKGVSFGCLTQDVRSLV